MPWGYEKEKQSLQQANAQSRVPELQEGLWTPEIAWEIYLCKMQTAYFIGRLSTLLTCLEGSAALKGLRTTGPGE